MFGKTNLTDSVEQALLGSLNARHVGGLSPIPNPVFLYDVGQLYESRSSNATSARTSSPDSRLDRFRNDLSSFLGLESPLRPYQSQGESTGASKSSGGRDKAKNKKGKLKHMDICDEQYAEIRKELVAIGTKASAWILDHFLKSDQVFVSSPDYFGRLLEAWKLDPCHSQTAQQ